MAKILYIYNLKRILFNKKFQKFELRQIIILEMN